MDKRYTVTFKPTLSDIEEPLRRVKDLGVVVQSAQRFIGTAIVRANEEQIRAARKVDGVEGITETSFFSAM